MTLIKKKLAQKLDEELWNKLRIDIFPGNDDTYGKLYVELWNQICSQLNDQVSLQLILKKLFF